MLAAHGALLICICAPEISELLCSFGCLIRDALMSSSVLCETSSVSGKVGHSLAWRHLPLEICPPVLLNLFAHFSNL
jgi:hypothetical protein